MSTHARQAYTIEINELEHALLDMGSRAESMVGQSVEALVGLDVALALSVIKRDDEIDERDLSIEAHCLRLLALQQPMAGDLRVIGTAMKMITDIERVADLAVDISKITLKVEKELGSATIIDIPKMAHVARVMFREALESFVRHDLEKIQGIVEMEDIVDDLYRELRGQLFTRMRQDPANVVSDSWLLLAIHHVERIADHSVNIAERVNFMVTGEFTPLARRTEPRVEPEEPVDSDLDF